MSNVFEVRGLARRPSFRMQTRSVACLVWCLIGTGCSFFGDAGLTAVPRDGAISAEVEEKLARDQAGGLSAVLVTTEAGVVTLIGTVERAEQKARAADLARQVNGVKRVKNDIDIRPSSGPPSRDHRPDIMPDS